MEEKRFTGGFNYRPCSYNTKRASESFVTHPIPGHQGGSQAFFILNKDGSACFSLNKSSKVSFISKIWFDFSATINECALPHVSFPDNY